MDTGARITELRKQAGLTQEQLAQRLYVSRELVSKWEQGTRKPDHSEWEGIARALGVEAAEIIDEETLILEELKECVPEGAEERKADIVRLLNEFLPKQGQKAKSMFIRRYHFHETTAEIGQMFDTSEAYVRTVLSRTRRKLKHFLKEHAVNE